MTVHETVNTGHFGKVYSSSQRRGNTFSFSVCVWLMLLWDFTVVTAAHFLSALQPLTLHLIIKSMTKKTKKSLLLMFGSSYDR